MPAPSRRVAAALVLSVVAHGSAIVALLHLADLQPQPSTAPAPIEVALLTPPKPAPVAPPAPPALPAPPKQVEAPKPITPAPPKKIPKPVHHAPEPRREAPAPTAKAEPAPTAPAAPATPAPPVATAPAVPTPAAPPAPAAPAAPVHTGVSIPASYAATNRPPVQPPRSIRNGEEGSVMLRVQVLADGSAGQVEIAKSSGFPMLDEAAKSAVQSWRFHPATIDGKPVTEWFRVPITFKLSN
jgi:protein TonB